MKLKIQTVLTFLFIFVCLFFPAMNCYKTQLENFYQAINEWELSPADSVWLTSGSTWGFVSEPDTVDWDWGFTDNIVINIDGWEGNVYIVKDNGDTIFKYIKEKSNETHTK